LCSLDDGDDLVIRFRVSGLIRREFSVRVGTSVSTLDSYVWRERRASLPIAMPVNRTHPVDLIASAGGMPEVGAAARWGGVAVRLANDRSVEVPRGFDAQLLRGVLAVLEAGSARERVPGAGLAGNGCAGWACRDFSELCD
jgi:hypothetical protein